MLDGFVFVEMTNQILSINNARLQTFLAILKYLYLKTTLYLPICAQRLHIYPINTQSSYYQNHNFIRLLV